MNEVMLPQCKKVYTKCMQRTEKQNIPPIVVQST